VHVGKAEQDELRFFERSVERFGLRFDFGQATCLPTSASAEAMREIIFASSSSVLVNGGASSVWCPV
jgi:hypothetical protein